MSECAPPRTVSAQRPPKVSVLVPTRNYAAYLPEALESVLAQTWTDYELVIGDDASTDSSDAIIRRYAAQDSRIRFRLHATHLGMVENWNGCLGQARGEYVKFLFGDDALAHPDALQRLVHLLDTIPTAALAACPRLLLDARSRVSGIADELAPGVHAGAPLIARCLRRRTNLIGEPSTVMFRRADARRGFDPHFRQIVDLEFWFHLLLRGDLAYDPAPLCAFRRHATQQTNVNHRSHTPHLEMLQLLERYLPEPRVQVSLPPGSFARRRLAFCHQHYARKAVADHPDFAAALAGLDRQLPWPWRAVCWMLHRGARPVENLRRKLRSWAQRARRSTGRGPVLPLGAFTR